MKKSEISISIIIPVYNVEKYVSRCLQSVFQQWNENIEIIIVDDGSTDSSGEICRNMIENASIIDTIQIVSQCNQGLSGARNKGLELAIGKYIMFLDSDDELSPDAVSVLLDNVYSHPEVDIFYYDADIVDELNREDFINIYNRKNKIPSDKVFCAQEYFSEYYVDRLVVSACLCLIRKDTIEKNGLKFDEGRLYEDNVFSLSLLLNSRYVSYLPNKLYVRRYRANSITTSSVSHKKIEDICFLIKRILEYKDKVTSFKSKRVCNAFFSVIFRMFSWGIGLMNQAGWKLVCMYDAIETAKEIISKTPYEYRSCTYYLLMLYLEEKRDKDVVFKTCLRHIVRNCYKDVFSWIKEYDNERIAIYGRGKHTNLFLEGYANAMGEPLKFVAYADSFQDGGYAADGKPVVNIANIGDWADVLVISSYHYRLEMLKKCRDIDIKVKILDFYESEKLSLFDCDLGL